MKINLRTRWSEPVTTGVLTLFFALKIIIYAETILNPYLIVFSILFIVSSIRFFGTRLIINDEFLEYQHWMLKKKKVLMKDIKDVNIKKGLILEALVVSTPDMSFRIYPYFSVTLISIMSVITGRPYNFGEAHIQLNKELKKKRKIDLAIAGVLVIAFFGLLTYRLAVINQPKISLIRITPNPEFPEVAEPDSIYSLYVSDIRIWSEEDAANAALSVMEPKTSFYSKFFYNTYLVYYNDNSSDRFYVIYRIGLPNDESYVFYVYKGESDVYYREYGQ
ncbi:hypothetical protein RJI07_06150 [Mycoplasmatota bacterium WC30]